MPSLVPSEVQEMKTGPPRGSSLTPRPTFFVTSVQLGAAIRACPDYIVQAYYYHSFRICHLHCP